MDINELHAKLYKELTPSGQVTGVDEDQLIAHVGGKDVHIPDGVDIEVGDWVDWDDQEIIRSVRKR